MGAGQVGVCVEGEVEGVLWNEWEMREVQCLESKMRMKERRL